jgi:pimeloyl-ACP methyl ester carboxylesterase
MKIIEIPKNYIAPIDINNLKGRCLNLPNKSSSRKILFIYGHHSSLERWWGLMQALNEYGDVTMPDLPGFGGMDSFYKIGKKPTLDNMADYLKKFIKQHYKEEK